MDGVFLGFLQDQHKNMAQHEGNLGCPMKLRGWLVGGRCHSNSFSIEPSMQLLKNVLSFSKFVSRGLKQMDVGTRLVSLGARERTQLLQRSEKLPKPAGSH